MKKYSIIRSLQVTEVFFLKMQVQRFRQERPGPESALLDQVMSEWVEPSLLPGDKPVWIANSLPLGAGLPDVLIVKFEPELLSAMPFDKVEARILAYLRSVNRASRETVGRRIGLPDKVVGNAIDGLLRSKALTSENNVLAIASPWRNILTDIASIEVKVDDWRRGARQATRNQIFSHTAYVALPDRIASRVVGDDLIISNHLGIISIASDKTQTVRRARKSTPITWFYHYLLASQIIRALSKD